jgi:hypothetical protein
LTTVEERLSRLEDERDILRTLYRYAHTRDYDDDPSGFLDCFTDTAVWWSSIEGQWAGTQGGRFEGRAALEAWFRGPANRPRPPRGSPGRWQSHHSIANAQIRIDGDRATVESYGGGLHERENGPLLYSLIRYSDVLVRCPDGKWRFQERHLSRESVHHSAQHLPGY